MNSNLIDIQEKSTELSSNLLEYEIYKINDKVHNNIHDLIKEHPNIITDKKILIYLINWPFGMGSAITVHIQNAFYLDYLNPNILVLPHFSENTRNFKYHEESYINSFFYISNTKN